MPDEPPCLHDAAMLPTRTTLRILVAATALLGATLAGVATAPPAAACVGDSCGEARLHLQVSPGPYRYGKPIQMLAEAEDVSYSCLFAGRACSPPSGWADFYVDGFGDPIVRGTLHDVCPEEADRCSRSRTEWLTSSAIRAGTPEIVVRYVPEGADPFDRTEGRWKITIAPAPVDVDVDVDRPSAAYGARRTLSARVTPAVPVDYAHGAHPPLGFVAFVAEPASGGPDVDLGGATIDDHGVATITTRRVPAGTSRIVASYRGDGDYTAGTGARYVDTAPGDVTNLLTQSASSTVYGESFRLTSTVAAVAPAEGTPSGDVVFRAGSTDLGTATLDRQNPNTAAVDVSTLPVGSHALTAAYQGDAGFVPKTSAAITHNVVKADTTTTLAPPTPNPSDVGQDVTLSAVVNVAAPGAGVPTGAVQFLDGATPLGNAVPLLGTTATMTTKALGGGGRSLSARYLGDANFNPSTSAAQPHTVRCDVVTTNVAGNYTAPASRTTCIANGYVGGTVTVPASARLSLSNVRIGGNLVVNSGAAGIVVCASSIGGDVTVVAAAGPVIIGSPFADACAGNTVGASAKVASNRGGVRFDGNRINANLQATGNSGGPTVIGGNTIAASLQCSGNTPAATNGGRSNSAAVRSGECASPSF